METPEFKFHLPAKGARDAFNKEIMPYIEDLEIFTVGDLEAAFWYFKNKVIPNAKSKSDFDTYTRLIRYKSVDSSDDQFFSDLESVLDGWYDRATKRMEQSNEQAKSDGTGQESPLLSA